MKHLLFILTLLVCNIATALADSTIQQPQNTEVERPIILIQRQNPTRDNRCPARPINGYYDGTNLFIDMTNFEEVDLIIYIHYEDFTHEREFGIRPTLNRIG